MSERGIATARDGGFTLVELLISVAITGIIAVVLASAVHVAFASNSTTTERFNGANDSLTATNVFSADIAATPPGGREVGEGLPSECAGGDQAGSFNVLRLTWSEQAAGVVTYYRTSYRIVNTSTGAGNLVRVSCTSNTGAHTGYGAAGSRLIASSLTPVPPTWVAGQVPAVLAYSNIDGSDMTLTLTVNTKPFPTTVVVSGQRVNPAQFLSAEPVASATREIRLVTSASDAAYTSAGSLVHFSTIVLNAGTTTLSSVGIADAIADAGSVSCPTAFLVGGASTTCTFTHLATQADLDGGSITSTTTAAGTPPTGPVVTASSNSVTVPAVQSPAMTAVKVAETPGCSPATCYKVAGDVINYLVTVNNTGNVTLTALSLTDPKADAPSPVSCSPATVAPGGTATCSYRYTIASSDLGIGKTVNTAATVTATTLSTTAVSATSGTVSVPFQANPSITATKSSSSPSYVAAGQILDYSIVVTNTGNVALSSVTVTDPNANVSPVPCLPSTIAPGAFSTCTAHHTVTALDVTNGSVVNQATAFGTPASGGPPISAVTNTVTVALNAAPAMSLTKSVTTSPNTFKNVGDVLDYTLTVKNTGGATLTGIAISDPKDSDGVIGCGVYTLVPLASTTCSARHIVVATDLGNPIVNTATATANTSVVPATVSATSNTVTVNFVAAPSLTVSMTAAPSPFTTVNAVLTYTMTIRNTGNVPLSTVGITARTLSASSIPSCGASTLAVGASTTCTSTYTTTLADSSRSVTNTVTASGTFNAVVYTATSGSVTVNSSVPCSVQNITASPTTVSRSPSGKLSQNVTVNVATSGACSGLRIQYYPEGGGGVIDTLSNPSASSWVFPIPSSGNDASKWDPGSAKVDVLPVSGMARINSTNYFPFVVT